MGITKSHSVAALWQAARGQMRSFSQALYNFANPQAIAPADFTYATWQQAWQQVANLAHQERLALFVDEFTYLLEVRWWGGGFPPRAKASDDR